MFDPDLVLKNAAGTNVTFALTQNGADGTVRVDRASARATPRRVAMKHQRSGGGNGKTTTDRHLFQLTEDVATSNGPVALTMNLSIAVPQAAEVTDQKVIDMIAHLVDFFVDGTLPVPVSSTNTSRFLAGES